MRTRIAALGLLLLVGTTLLATNISSAGTREPSSSVVRGQQAPSPEARRLLEEAARADARPSPLLASARAAVVGQEVYKDATLSWPLVQLAGAQASAAAYGAQISGLDSSLLPKSLRDLGAARLMRMDGTRVQVFVHPDGPISSVSGDLEANGARVERASAEHSMIQAWIPAGQLRSMAELPGVARIRLPDYGFTQAGSLTTEGDAILSASSVRSTYGVDGTGIRVGVISDGVEGLGLSQATGDLPPVNTTTCNVVAQGASSAGAGAEGTAMLEIVHDLAPGAELWFGHFGYGFSGTVLDFMNAVDCLAANTDVVVDDIGWYNVGSYDGTSIVSMNASATLSGGDPIRGYYNAVGNDALEHYQESWADSGFTYEELPDFWNLQRFASTANTGDAGLGLPCACADTIALAPGEVVSVSLQWNDPFGSSGNDYDLFLYLGDILVAVGGDFQGGAGYPAEFLAYVNDSPGLQILDLAIGNFNGTAAPRTFDMFLSCPGCAPLPDELFGQPLHNFNTPCSSVSNNSDAGGGVVSLGAIYAGDPGWNDIEPFSSCGPTNDGRLKPEAAAIDGVVVTGNGGFGSPFFGTSAAAPHAAGIAALLLDCNPALTRTQLRDALLNKAVDLGPAGLDYGFGHGRLNAFASAGSVGCAGAPATNTPPPVAPTATPTQPPVAPTATPAGLIGDSNCNGVINAIDAALVLQYTARLILALTCAQNADANQNGIVDVIDATLILQLAAGYLDHLPP